jgi:hypothetical protein
MKACYVHSRYASALRSWGFDLVAELTTYQQILKPAEKKQKYVYGGMGSGRPITPPRKQKKK